jgi:hypothetical protein
VVDQGFPKGKVWGVLITNVMLRNVTKRVNVLGRGVF